MALLIGGHVRSGTTLLRDLFTLHPDITVTHELETFMPLGLSHKEYVQSMLRGWRRKGIINYRILRRPGVGWNRWRKGYVIRGHVFTIRYLYKIFRSRRDLVNVDIIESALREIFPRSRIVGDKWPDYVKRLDDFAGTEGLSHFIIYRDCRDVVSSTLKLVRTRWSKQPWTRNADTAEKVARRWVKAVETMLRHREAIFCVRYEDLIENPKEVLGAIGSRLGVEPSGFPWKLVRHTSIGKYRMGLTPDELEIILQIAGPSMERLGYSIDRPGAGNRSYLAVKTPLSNPEAPVADKKYAQSALIIAGHPRSGTTLLNRVINSHPQATMTFEFNCFHGFDLPYAKYLRRLRMNWHQRRLIVKTRGRGSLQSRLDSAIFLARFIGKLYPHKHEPISFDLIRRILFHLFPASKIVGDKKPPYIFKMDRLAQIQGLKRVVIYRDCRDVVQSCLIKNRLAKGVWGKNKYSTAARVAGSWLRAVEMMEQYSENLHRVRYEDLVRRPVDVLLEIGQWLDLDPEGFRHERVRTTSLGKYKKELSRRQVEEVLSIAGDTMKRLGYS
jgi:hypothetical protein